MSRARREHEKSFFRFRRLRASGRSPGAAAIMLFAPAATSRHILSSIGPFRAFGNLSGDTERRNPAHRFPP